MTTALAIMFLWWVYPCMEIIRLFKGEGAAMAFYDKVGSNIEKTFDFIFNKLFFDVLP